VRAAPTRSTRRAVAAVGLTLIAAAGAAAGRAAPSHGFVIINCPPQPHTAATGSTGSDC
jgi:hypothetical protein